MNNPAAELPDLIVNCCPLGCNGVCIRIWRNEITGHRIVCRCNCEHKRIASPVEEPKADTIQEPHLVRRTQQYGV
jgi:hypothetical protein